MGRQSKHRWVAACLIALSAVTLSFFLAACSGSSSSTTSAAGESDSSAIPENSLLYFRDDEACQRLKDEMDSGRIPARCSVLYDEEGTRPTVMVDDSETITKIYELLAHVTVSEKSDESAAGGNHAIVFYLNDSGTVSIRFEGDTHLVRENKTYQVDGTEELWKLVRKLQDDYLQAELETVAQEDAEVSSKAASEAA